MKISSDFNIYIMILGAAILTYIPRSFPILYLSNKKIPKWFKEWMKFIPPAIFAALICPDIFINNGNLAISFSNIKLISGIIVLIVAIKKKSLGISIVVGVISIYLLNLLV